MARSDLATVPDSPDVTSLAASVPKRDRCLPVADAFASMLPDAGLVRGRVVGCTGPAAMSLACGLAARAVGDGAWVAAVGLPMLGVEAAVAMGIVPTRLVAVEVDGGPPVWAERVAVAADGFDLIITRAPSGASRVERRVRQRLQARGVVLLTVAPSTPALSCDVEFATTETEWVGLGDGYGALRARRVTKTLGGRRVPRPVERELWLPGPDGTVAAVDDPQQRSVDPVTLEHAG